MKHIVLSEYEEVKNLLIEDIHFITQKGSVTDCAGKTFENISGFQLAVYYLDTNAWTMIIECVCSDIHKKEVLEKLISQFDELDTHGVSYIFKNKKFKEKHFNFSSILKALTEQVNLWNEDNSDSNAGNIQLNEKHFNFSNIINAFKEQINPKEQTHEWYEYNPDLDVYPDLEEPDWNAMTTQWIKRVGAAQRHLPMHVVHAYCSEGSLNSVQGLNSPKKSTFYNPATNSEENWFAKDSKLGVDFAIFKGGAERGMVLSLGYGATQDLAEMTVFADKRTTAFNNLRSLLEKQLQLISTLSPK